MTAYLTLEEVLRIHDVLLDAFGGAPGVRDLGLIESALLRPQTGYYADIIEEAAALWESLGMNHGFIDGNKRAAFQSAALFLRLNGSRLTADRVEATKVIFAVAAGRVDIKALAGWLRENCTTDQR